MHIHYYHNAVALPCPGHTGPVHESLLPLIILTCCDFLSALHLSSTSQCMPFQTPPQSHTLLISEIFANFTFTSSFSLALISNHL